MLDTLEELVTRPTAPFNEHFVNEGIEEWFYINLDHKPDTFYSEDNSGNIIIKYRGESHPKRSKLVFASHSDHPGFLYSGEYKGKTILKMIGRLENELAIGSEVDLHGEFTYTGCAKIIDSMDKAMKNPSKRYLAEMISGKKEFDFATPDVGLYGLKEDDDMLYSPAMDDLGAAAMSLEAMKKIVDEKIPLNVSVIIHRGEEAGFIGAMGAIDDKWFTKDAFVISLETSSYKARESPKYRYKNLVDIGGGIVIRTGDKRSPAFDIEALSLLHETALNTSGKVQMAHMFGGTCEGSLYHAAGHRAGALCLPLYGYHNNGLLEGNDKFIPEGIHKRDYIEGIDYLVDVAKTLADRPEMYKRHSKKIKNPKQRELLKMIRERYKDYRAEGLI